MKRILICDDDEIILGLSKSYLESVGYEVMILQDGVEIFDSIDQFKPDVLILDLELGFYSGDEIIKDLRSKAATQLLPIILWTSHIKGEKIAYEAGADDFIPKPVDFTRLMLAIEEMSTIEERR